MSAKPSRRVFIFGGGISGLTAAHELAERGFDVMVIEPEPDRRHYGRPELGGLARTQWCVAPARSSLAPAGDGESERWGGKRALPLLAPVRLFFNVATIDLANPEKLDEYVERYRSTYPRLHDTSPQPRIRVNGFRRRGEQQPSELTSSRATKVVEMLRNALGLEHEQVALDKPGEWPVDHLKPELGGIGVRVDAVAVPGEHGFRFFPAFYRHVFDTMGRIRLLDDRTSPSARPFGTVLDNLVPTHSVTIGLAGEGLRAGEGAQVTPLQLSRDLPRSLSAVRRALESVLTGLGHTPHDVAHLALKLTKYMTSGPRRRATYEGMSFAAFLEVEKLSPACRKHVDLAPEVLAGMRSSESDARTQGSVTVQLLLSQLGEGRYLDATLNGPTGSAWMAPWRDYLTRLRVKFRQGKLTGFRLTGARVTPEVTWLDDEGPAGLDGEDWFVVAIPLTSLLPEDVGGDGLCLKLMSVVSQGHLDPGDFGALSGWINHVGRDAWRWNGEEQPTGPLRHVSGIQYYFDTDQHPTVGHTIYADSAWRLSSISQLGFWTGPAPGSIGFRGIVSVDIGEWHTPRSGKLDAWHTEPDGMADEVWRQISDTLPGKPPRPRFYHLDDGLVLRSTGASTHRKYDNATPYLITRPDEWHHRPGDPKGYQVAADRWVLCGTFMKTSTRMTTMESANESARLAVNALLEKYDIAAGASPTPTCALFPLENHELDDLKWLKDVDDSLQERGAPHALDIVEAGALIDALFPHRIRSRKE